MTRSTLIRTATALAVLALTGRAEASALVLTDSWQNLGSGPLLLETLGGDAQVEASASAPTDQGLTVFNQQTPFYYQSATAIWAKRRTPSRGTTLVYGAITSWGGSGGGGGGGSVTQGTSPWVDNVSQFGGAAVVTGVGASGAGIPRVTVSNDSSVTVGSGTNQIGALLDGVTPAGFPATATATGVMGSVIDTASYATVSVQITGTFVGTVSFQGSDDQTNWSSAIGIADASAGSFADATSATSVGLYTIATKARYVRLNVTAYTSGTITAAASLRSNTLPARSVYLAGGALATTSTSGGVTNASRIPSSAASTNLTAAKPGAGRVFKVYACNTQTSARFIKFYDLASGSVTVGTTAVKVSRELPPSQCSSYDWSDLGFYFATAISYAITAGTGIDSDTTAVAAGDIVQVSVEYQ